VSSEGCDARTDEKHVQLLSGGWLQTPVSARPVMAARRSAELQQRFCNAAPVPCVVGAVDRLAMAAARLSDALERAPAPPAEVHGHDCQTPRRGRRRYARAYSGELGTMTHGSRCPATDVRDAAVSVGHARPESAKGTTMTDTT
jgi:hypothetical protein